MSKTNQETTHKLAKLVARSGYASRREAEKLIVAGKVLVDGKTVVEVAARFPEHVEINVKGVKSQQPGRSRLWAYHKPRGQITTHRDPEGRPTVFAALPKELGRVVSVGRLDCDSEGLLLLSNDGGIAGRLEKSDHPRVYRVRAQGIFTPEYASLLRKGLVVDGVFYAPIIADVERQTDGHCWLRLVLSEGKNREIRRVLQHFGLRVNRLIRVSFAGVMLNDLPAGKVRELTPDEIAHLLPERNEG